MNRSPNIPTNNNNLLNTGNINRSSFGNRGFGNQLNQNENVRNNDQQQDSSLISNNDACKITTNLIKPSGE